MQSNRLNSGSSLNSEILLEKSLREAEAEAARLDELENADAEEDYVKYLFYAQKYGPLDGMMYCSSARPGRGE